MTDRHTRGQAIDPAVFCIWTAILDFRPPGHYRRWHDGHRRTRGRSPRSSALGGALRVHRRQRHTADPRPARGPRAAQPGRPGAGPRHCEEHRCTGSAPSSSSGAGPCATREAATSSESGRSGSARSRRSCRSSSPSGRWRPVPQPLSTRRSRWRFSTATSPSSSPSRRPRSRCATSRTSGRRRRPSRRRAAASCSRRCDPPRSVAVRRHAPGHPDGRRLTGWRSSSPFSRTCASNGYAENREETADGLYAASVPIVNQAGTTLAALTTLVPSSRVTAERREVILRELIDSRREAVRARVLDPGVRLPSITLG